MYRIVKRIVRTITVVTWAIRYANADGHTVEEEITLPEIHQVSVQELPDPEPPPLNSTRGTTPTDSKNED